MLKLYDACLMWETVVDAGINVSVTGSCRCWRILLVRIKKKKMDMVLLSRQESK